MKTLKQITAFLLVFIITVSVSLNTFAAGMTLSQQLNSDKSYGVSFDYKENASFAEIREEYEKKGYNFANIDKPITINAAGYSLSDKKIQLISEHENRENVILWSESNKFIEWKFKVSQNGIYNLRMEYMSYGNKVSAIRRSLQIDGKSFYSEAENLSFYRLFKDDGAPITNSLGDEIAPDVKQYFGWQWQEFLDTDASFDGALQFYLTKGTHTLRMGYVTGDLYLSSIELFSPSTIDDYAAVSKKYQDNGYKPGDDKVYFEAESDAVLYKNSSTLRSSANGDPACTPFKYGKSLINVLGGTNWQSANSAVTYSFEVKSSGLYMLSMRLLMNYRDGIPSYRSIAIDGNIPFNEFSAYKFVYSSKWRDEILSDENGDPYYVYLEKGNHTLTLSVKQGDISPINAIMEKDSDLLSETLLKIKMFVGQNPDVNYDYELDKQIPDLIPNLKSVISDMKACMEDLEKLCGKKQSKYYQIKSFVSQIEELINDPFIIPSKISSVETIITSYGSWLTEMQQHPLMLDYIQIIPKKENKLDRKSNFFQRLYGSTVNFFLSFIKDYNNVSTKSLSDKEIKETISVWVSRGTKWCETMKQLIDSDFTPNTGIAVNLNILPAGQLNAGGTNALLLAITSGRAPDVATGVASSSIGEFAMRNALKDISEMDGFNDVKLRFKEKHFVSLSYKNGVFALPETQNFSCMVYRKDIFSKLGLSIPNTWEEVYDKIIPVLNQNNMQFYVPMTDYNIFLYQHGGKYYNDDLLTTALDSPEAYNALVEYTNLFLLYGVPKAASFYNRFRSGEMPVGIVDYTNYMTVKSVASDLNGKWGVALIPGHKNSDGTINRSHTSLSNECCMLLGQSKKTDSSWKFLKWWTSDDIQLEYANRLESLMGTSARWASANWKAFTNLPWEIDEIDQIEKSFDYAEQIPVVLGGYYVTRHINNALNRVIISEINPRNSIETAVEDINRELQRRREVVS